MDYKENQATINIGMIGSVSNGKSSLTYQLTGIKTQKHSDEQKNNITMKLGYANSKIYKCSTCPNPQSYQPHPSNVFAAKCKLCGNDMILQAHISLIDCPGHHQLMATMLNGTCVMDSAILVESASNNEFPSQQTLEHLQAVNLVGLKPPISCLNKIDTVSKDVCTTKANILKDLLKDTNIVPISANLNINIDVVCEYICNYIVKENNIYDGDLKMIIIRSFNINKQEAKLQDLQGGVVGGSITRGTIRIGDTVTILPGLLYKKDDISMIKWKYRPIITQVESINSEKNSCDVAVSGGLIGVRLTLDPALTAHDNLIGSLVVSDQTKFKVYERIKISIKLIDKHKDLNICKNDILLINYNAINVEGKVLKINVSKKTGNNIYELILCKPICVELKDCITLSKKFDTFEILGLGKIIAGIESQKYDD